MLNASAGLVAALNASLANGAHAWRVVSARETSTGGESVTTVTDVVLAAALPMVVGSRIPMSLSYRYVMIDGSFDHAVISWSGGEWRTTNSTMRTTVSTLAASFLAAGDTALTAALGASPLSPALIPGDLLAAIKTSIANSEHEWQVRSVCESRSADFSDLTIGLSSTVFRVPVQGQMMRAQMTYMARLDALGALVSARVLMNGAEWLSTDGPLHTTITTLASAYRTAQAVALTAALED